jgi:hypothetical protein
MSRALFPLCVVISVFCQALPASNERGSSLAQVAFARDSDPAADPGTMEGGGGGGQAEYSGERRGAFSRFAGGATVSTLGIGVQAGTNLGPRLDLRLFGNYTNLTHRFTQSGFSIAVNVGMANAGAVVDFYPLRRFPLRVSPGYLYFNQNRVAAGLQAGSDATFTINNVEYLSDNTDPVHATGRLILGGSGLLATAGLGPMVSHTRKHFTFPFEIGVVFINTPVAQFNLLGKVCSETITNFCERAAQFPTFAENLAAQVKSWNDRVAPFHVYPIVQGGVAYTFSWRGRSY